MVSLGVIFYVQYVEHQRSRVPNGVVLFFWLVFLLAYVVKLRSLASQQGYERHLAYFTTTVVTTVLATLELGLVWLVPKKQTHYLETDDEHECPYEYASVFSVLSFSWM